MILETFKHFEKILEINGKYYRLEVMDITDYNVTKQ